MDWEYFINSNFSNCVKNGVICSSIILILKSSSNNFYKKLNLNKSNILNRHEKMFLKQFYLIEQFYINFTKQRSIIKNPELRIHLYVFIFLFFNLGVKSIYDQVISKNRNFNFNSSKKKVISTLDNKLTQNIITYGVSGMIFGYLFFGKIQFMLYCGLINSFNGFIYHLTYHCLNNRIRHSKYNLITNL